jgi:hypothetical protein
MVQHDSRSIKWIADFERRSRWIMHIIRQVRPVTNVRHILKKSTSLINLDQISSCIPGIFPDWSRQRLVLVIHHLIRIKEKNEIMLRCVEVSNLKVYCSFRITTATEPWDTVIIQDLFCFCWIPTTH